MAYTEIKERNGRKYFYRVISERQKGRIKKYRKYLGVNLSKKDLAHYEKETDGEMSRKDSLQSLKPKIIEVLKKNGIKKAGVFGSYARGEQRKGSDIDIIIEAPKNIGLGFVMLALELEKRLRKKVDLLTYNGLSKYLKNQILKEEVRIV